MKEEKYLIAVCMIVIIAVFGGVMVLREYLNRDSVLKENDAGTVNNLKVTGNNDVSSGNGISVKRFDKLTAEENQELLRVYKFMKDGNPDFAGYLRIEGTELAYPVMYSPTDPEKYLHLDINGQECDGGLPFVDTRCSLEPDSDNVIIYGHNMKDGSMFSNIISYQDKTYFESYPTVRFDTTDEVREYRIMSAFYDRVYYTDETGVFKFYDFIDAADKDKYNEAVAQYKKKSIYDTGVTAEYGDKLLTLVTCAYHTDEGRFVVVAVRDDR